MKAVEDSLTELLKKKLSDTDIFIVDVRVLPKGKIRVDLDSDSGLTIDQCEEVSRYLEPYLDTEERVPSTYNLEVSSPGVGRPLKLIRQYKKNIGRQVEVSLQDGEVVKGKLLDADEDRIRIDAEESHPQKKHKVITREKEIALDKIKETKVTISF